MVSEGAQIPRRRHGTRKHGNRHGHDRSQGHVRNVLPRLHIRVVQRASQRTVVHAHPYKSYHDVMLIRGPRNAEQDAWMHHEQDQHIPVDQRV
eukprot:1150540-Pyramimonas_sp.AAC.1